VSGQDQYWVVASDGKEYGPADLETLRQWAKEGRVVHATHIRKAGGGTIYAGKMPELADVFPPRDGQAAVPPGQYAAAPSTAALPLPSEFRVWEFIGRGWDVVKPHWLPLSAMFAIYWLICGMVPYLGACAQFIIGGTLMVGIWRAILGTIDGRKPDVGMMFQGFDRFGDAFLAHLISSILIVLGFVCLIVPGIILAIMWMFTLPVIGETPLGFWEAMRESSRLTEGYRWRLFLLALACLLVFLLGLLVFCVGVFVSLAVNVTAMGLAYRFLQAKKGRSAQAPA
jgi:uncharacterized membrane protein